MQEEIGTPTSTEKVEETTEVTEETTEETPEESVDDLKARLAKAEEEKENQKKRAEKAEKKAKEAPKVEEVKTDSTMSQKDILYIAKAEIHEDDMEEFTNTMSKMGMTAKEAHEFLAPRFAVKAEERKTAAATQTKSPRGTKPNTGEDLLSKVEGGGDIPTSDAEMQKMILAKQNRFKKKEQ